MSILSRISVAAAVLHRDCESAGGAGRRDARARIQLPDPTAPASATRRSSRRSTCRAGNIYRSGSGAPGPKYWQNRADYDLKATLDTAAKTLHRRADAALHEQLARHAALRLVAGRAERVQGQVAQLVRLPAGLALRRARLRGRRRRSSASTRSLRRQATRARSRRASNGTVMKVDLAEPLAPGHDGDVRRRVALPHPRARRRPHGSRRRAVRARAVVSARRRLRRRARLEHRAVPRPGRVLSRVRRLQRSTITVPAGYIVAGTGALTNAARGAHADADLAARAGGEVGDAGAHRHAGRAARAARRARRRRAR